MKIRFISLFLLIFIQLGLNAQQEQLSNPLQQFIGDWKVLTPPSADNPEPQVRFYWKATGVEVGYGLQTTIYRVSDENPKEAAWTLYWACDPRTGQVFSLNTFPNGNLERREGSIDENGTLALKSNSVGDNTDNENYNINTWRFESKDKIQVKRIDYKKGKEAGVGVELEMVRIK